MHGHGKGFEPYILSLFFFILFGNLFGLIPPPGEMIALAQALASGHVHAHAEVGETTGLIPGFWSGMTFTGDVAVTAALATITTLLIWITGFRYQRLHFLWSFMPSGLNPVMFVILYPMLFLLEFLVGPLAKGFALTVRLLANMTAGHIIILALLGFIFQFGVYVAAVAVPGAAAILMLEIFVGFLQAFIFALLTAIFVGSSMHAH
jgi:F-type H+-transporting ATPase subunit a